jgi:hypothetical protein
MTQVVDEQDEQDEAVSAPVTHEEPTDEEQEADDAHERETAGEEPAEASRQEVGTETQLRALEKKLTNERKRHSGKLSDILGDASTDALPCPLCFEALMGFVLPGDAASLPEEQRTAALAFLGADAPSELEPAEGAVMCARCNGFGRLEWPTRNPHLEKQTCPRCHGNGYVLVEQQQATVTPLPGVVTAADAQANGVVGPCSRCGAPNSEGRPHFCNPQPQ